MMSVKGAQRPKVKVYGTQSNHRTRPARIEWLVIAAQRSVTYELKGHHTPVVAARVPRNPIGCMMLRCMQPKMYLSPGLGSVDKYFVGANERASSAFSCLVLWGSLQIMCPRPLSWLWEIFFFQVYGLIALGIFCGCNLHTVSLPYVLFPKTSIFPSGLHADGHNGLRTVDHVLPYNVFLSRLWIISVLCTE